MVVGVASEPAVTGPLLDYLTARLGQPHLAYRDEPEPIPEGWETYIYRFQLENTAGMPSEFAGPLILRMYPNGRALPRLRQEDAALRFLNKCGYPVAEPLVCETDAAVLGGPFVIMKQVPGRTLLDHMLRRPWWIVPGPVRLAEAHVRLHQLPGEEFPCPAGPFLTRQLDGLRTDIAMFDLPGLLPGLAWLRRHRPAPVADVSIVHLDFHPINVMMHQGCCRAVLDWGDSDVGDRHADVAVTLVLMKSVAVEVASAWHRLAIGTGRPWLYRWYLKAYRRRLPLEEERLRYYMAWAALRRLCRYGVWLRAGPQATGCKPTSLRHLTADRIDVLQRIFVRETGVGVHL